MVILIHIQLSKFLIPSNIFHSFIHSSIHHFGMHLSTVSTWGPVHGIRGYSSVSPHEAGIWKIGEWLVGNILIGK